MAENTERIIPVLMEEEMRSSYLDYSMSVIVSRALPDVRDGLKPVHRRILYGMQELALGPSRPYKKCARIVGEVLGKYHPHGDGAVYDAMVRMAQEWSLRYPLVDGQGNFGSVDGDSPAAMRYTEARMATIASEVLRDLDKDTVDFRPNFDESLEEPQVMPTVAPLLLINGAGGIAVGMATNIPPHNLTEVVNGLLAMIENPDVTDEELMEYISAPDFPTGGIIYGYKAVRDAYLTGRGRIIVRAKAHIEEMPGDRERIIVTELPYQVNKASLIEKMADMVRDKRLVDISDIRDESDREGLRMVIELKRSASGEVVLNNLYKHTALQTTFGVIMLALVNGRPRVLKLREILHHFITFRNEVLVRKTKFDLSEAEKRAHILEGLLKALDHIDEVIETIRSSNDVPTASARLQERFELSEVQAKAILEMRLQRLTGLERDKIESEYRQLIETIEGLRAILASKELQMQEISTELRLLRDKYGDERRTEIVHDAKDLTLEELIAEEDMIITISHQGFMKRTPLSEYRQQGRGGRGASGARTRNDDYVEYIFQAHSHSYLLLFTDRGRAYCVRVFELPEGGKNSKGRSIANVIKIESDEKLTTVLPVKAFDDERYIMMTTKTGVTKKTPLSAFSRVKTYGIIALGLNDNDRLINARITDGSYDIVIGTKHGIACRFHESDVRPMGRTAVGVRGISLMDGDEVVSMTVADNEELDVLVVSATGMGKRSKLEEFRKTKRGAKGIISMARTDKAGDVLAVRVVDGSEDLMIMTTRGITIRLSVGDIRVIGRNTQGVRLIRLDDGDTIADITVVPGETDDNNNELSVDEETGEVLTDESGASADAEQDSDAADEGDTDDASAEDDDSDAN